MQTVAILLILTSFLDEPLPQRKTEDPGGIAVKELDKQLSDILEGQNVVCRKIEYYFSWQVGRLPSVFEGPPAWDWPDDLRKREEKVFGRWKKWKK